MALPTTPAPRGVHYRSIGHASRIHRGALTYKEQADRLGIETEESLRNLERGTRPQTDVARRVIRGLNLDLPTLDRHLYETELDELAGIDLEGRVLLRDMFLVTVRRYKETGDITRLRANESPLGKAEPKRSTTTRKQAGGAAGGYNGAASRDSSVGRAAAIPTHWIPGLRIRHRAQRPVPIAPTPREALWSSLTNKHSASGDGVEHSPR